MCLSRTQEDLCGMDVMDREIFQGYKCFIVLRASMRVYTVLTKWLMALVWLTLLFSFITYNFVLVLTGMELFLFTVASMGLCFGCVLRAVLMTQEYFNSCWAVLTHYPSSEWTVGLTRDLDGTQLEPPQTPGIFQTILARADMAPRLAGHHHNQQFWPAIYLGFLWLVSHGFVTFDGLFCLFFFFFNY